MSTTSAAACSDGAITFDQSFENAVFDRSKLVKVLNHPGSHVEEKKIVKKPVAPAAAAASPAAAPAAKPAAEKPAADASATAPAANA